MLNHLLAKLSVAPDTDGAILASGSSVNAPSYKEKKKTLLVEFVKSLESYGDKYKDHTVVTQEVPSHFGCDSVAKVFITLSGTENKREKVEILNMMLIDWISMKRNKRVKSGSAGYPTPSTLNTSVRAFLSATKEKFNWQYTLADFKFEGGVLWLF